MNQISIAELALLLAALGGTVWVLTPLVMFALGLTHYRIEMTEDPAAAEPDDRDPDYARRYEQFKTLGFRPVGTTEEICWFMNPTKWYRRSRQPLRWLATADGRYLASFHRLIPAEPVRFGIVTLLSDGGSVRSTCPGAGVDRVLKNWLRVELQNVEPDELFERHQQQVEQFCQKRGLSVRRATFADAVETEEQYARYLLPIVGGRNLYQVPLLYFVGPTIALLFAASRMGVNASDWRVCSVAACGGTLTYAFFRLLVMRWMFRQACKNRHGQPVQPAASRA